MLGKLIFLFLFAVTLIHSYTIKQLNNPTSTVFDITKDPVSPESSIPMIMLEVEKITVLVNAITPEYSRDIKAFNCSFDEFSREYCPEGLGACDNFQNSNDGSSEEHSGEVVNSYPMSCPNGGTLNANGTCETICSSTTFSCPSGTTLSGNKCVKTSSSYAASCSYSCPNGGSVSGSTCIKTCQGTPTYSCPNGGELSGSTCKTTTSACKNGTTFNAPTGLCYDNVNMRVSWVAANNYCQSVGMRLPARNETGARKIIDPMGGGILGGIPGGIPSVAYANWTSSTRGGGIYDMWSGDTWGTFANDGSLGYVRCVAPPTQTISTTSATATPTSYACNYSALQTCVCGNCSTSRNSSVDSTPAIILTASPIVSGTSISCSSHDYAYNTCSASIADPITSVTLVQQASKSACVFNESYGLLDSTSMWIKSGCRGTFSLNSSRCPANYTYETSTNTCANKTTCPANYTYNSSAKNCQQTTYTCTGGGVLNGTTCVCPNAVGTSCNTPSTSFNATADVVNLPCTNNTASCPPGTSSAQTSYNATKAYSCPNGGTLSGETCVKTCTGSPTYTCANGGTLSGTTCTMASTNYRATRVGTMNYICPNGGTLSGFNCIIAGESYAATISSLDIQCNYAAIFTNTCPSGGALSGTTCTIPASSTQCSKVVPYEYYTYRCDSNTNIYGQDFAPVNTGGDNHIGSTPPANNCVQQDFICASQPSRTCSMVNNAWQCSPLECDMYNRCGVAQCVNGMPQPAGTSYHNSTLVGQDTSRVCNEEICDAVEFELLGSCVGIPRCPTAFGVYEESGNCYKDVCPAGATERELGGGNVDCLIPQCPTGFLKNNTGGCDAQ